MNFALQSTLHAAIIMDGNGRWAQQRGLPRVAGHAAGAETLRHIVESASDAGIAILTVYAFSSDNWKRPEAEVNALMELFASYLGSQTPRCVANDVRMSIIGRRDRLPASLVAAMQHAESATRGCGGLHLRLAVDYSARDAILRATHQAAGEQVTRERFEELLGESWPVDLLIRTGGEQRLSDFMLWECAYAELVFTERMWPDFRARDLKRCVDEFLRRERRFGEVVPAAIPVAAAASERWLL